MNVSQPGAANEGELNIVVGNILGAASIDQAKDWVSKRCGSIGIPQPADMFIKSDEFRGILCAKCLSIAHRDSLISGIQAGAAAAGGAWTKIHQPIDERTVDGILFAMKRMLVSVESGYTNRAVQVNKDTKVLSGAGKDIVKAAVLDFQLGLEWCDSEWQKWDELQTAEDFTKIQHDVQQKLNRAKTFASGDVKGKGKTKSS